LEGVFARGIRLPQLKGLLLPAGRVNLGSVPPGGRPADAPDRILFLVYDADNQLIDRLGLACVEGGGRKLRLDPLPNGLSSPAGQEAVVTLAQWARRTLWPDQIGVAVDLADRPTAAALQRLEFIGGSALADGQREFLAPALPPGRRAGDELILTAGPSIAGREATYALDAVKYGWNGQWGTYLKKFEAAFAGYVGAKHALATSSCTGALHIALQALGIGPGDEVIVPDITWVATANAVLYVGAPGR
jgi:perosamine synthetase